MRRGWRDVLSSSRIFAPLRFGAFAHEITIVRRWQSGLIDSGARCRYIDGSRLRGVVRPFFSGQVLRRKVGAPMILRKLWHSLMAQINKIANVFWTADPIAQMQYE
jgi:hypothetical protein